MKYLPSLKSNDSTCVCVDTYQIHICIKYINISYAPDTVRNGQSCVCPNPDKMVEGTIYQVNTSIVVDFVSLSLFRQLCATVSRIITSLVLRRWLRPMCSATDLSQNHLNLNFHRRDWHDLSIQPGDENRQHLQGFATQTKQLWHCAGSCGKPEPDSHLHHLGRNHVTPGWRLSLCEPQFPHLERDWDDDYVVYCYHRLSRLLSRLGSPCPLPVVFTVASK